MYRFPHYAGFALVLACACAQADVPPAVRALHERLIVLDSHLDTPMQLARPGWDISQRHTYTDDLSQVDLPRMREGGLDGGFFSVFTPQGPLTPEGRTLASEHGLAVITRIRDMVAARPTEFSLATEARQVPAIVASGRRVVLISMENAEPLAADPGRLCRQVAALLLVLWLVLPVAQASETLRVSSQKNSLQVLLQAAGELEDVPYPIEFAAFAAAAPTAEALAAGAVDIGTLGTAPFVFATSAGADLKAVGVVRLKVTPTAVAIVVPDGSPLTDSAGLVGRRITTTRGSIGHYLALAALRATGHSGRDASFVFLQPGESRSVLANGGADAWATWDPYTSMLQLEGGTRVLVSGEGLFAGNMLLVANPAAIRDKPGELRDFLQRLGRAWAWANTHAEQFAAIQARQSGLPQAVHLRSIHYSQPGRVAVDDALVQDLANTARLYQEEGVIATGFEAEHLVDRQFNSPQ